MKYLLILLFLFSTHSFSGEIDGKGIDCLFKVKRGEEQKMYWFNNGLVSQVTSTYKVKDGRPEIKIKPNIDIKEEKKLKEIKPIPDFSINEYNADADYIYWKAILNYKLNRKNLKITVDGEKKNLSKGTCRAFVGFEEVEKRQEELLQKAKDEYNKAREGNKI